MSDTAVIILDWLLYVVILPSALATLGAFPAWLKRRVTLGNLIGSVIVIAVIFVLIWQQYGAYVQAQATCTQSGIGCVSDAESLYMPYLYMVLLGWMDVFLLLFISGMVEDHLKRRRLDRSQL